MAIVCFLDPVGGSHVAVVGALLAQRMKTSCHLAQSTDEARESAAHHARAAWFGARLASRAERVRALTRDVHIHVLPGPAERQVGALADRLNAELIVTSATASGRRADLLAQHAHVPVLGVREEALFVRWGAELGPLRVVAAIMGEADGPVVLRMVRRLADAAPCEVHLVHVSNELAALEAERFAALLRREGAEPSWHVHSEQRRGPRAEQILALASAREAHLIVIGSRVMTRVSRLWERSVSRSILAQAPCSVLCVPVGAARGHQPLHCVMAATDLSPAGDAALSLAARVVAPGGVVHVVHVLSGADAQARKSVVARLEASTQALATRGVTWKVHVLHGDELAPTVQRAAREFAVDALCIGSKGTSERSPGTTIAALMSQVGCALLIANPSGG